MTSIVVEGCVTSPAEASVVTLAGAHRLELCRDLSTGGLTPDLEALEAVRGESRLPVFAMVRPRPGPFRATPRDVTSMLREMENLIAAGAKGLVLGVLDTSGHIDVGALRELVGTARVPVTFHRAFDEVSDPFRALEQLRESGVRRVLTAGGRGSAWEGRKTLQALVQAAGSDLTILGGGRVRGDHVRKLVEETGLQEVHARASAIPGIVGALSF